VPDYGGWNPAGPDDPSLEGGGYHPAPPSIEDDPHHALRGSLWYDDVFGPATQFVPDCHNLAQREYHPAEATWCVFGEAPDSTYQAILQTAAANVLARCPDLTTAWNRVKDGIRLWHHGSEDYGGATRPGERWMLLSYAWVDADPELIVAHELVHHLQKFHRDPNHTSAFIAKEKQCSGGRSALQ
jgi:hypothetical protein